MDRSLIGDLAHTDHPIASPLDDDTVDALLRRALAGQRSVLDLGCGDGTWLLRALRLNRGLHPELHAVGVDLSGAGFERTRTAADAEGLGDRLELHVADAAMWSTDERFDVVLSIGAAHAFGGLVPAVEAAASHLQPGGRLLVGECFWEQPPNDAALGALGASADDYANLASTVEAVRSAGWEPLHAHVSSLQEWDAYEWSWTGSLTRWALEHPDDPSSAEVLTVAAEHRAAWLGGYRGTLGFVTLLLGDGGP
ncbi:Methyltransferase domain-containing protein [Quadrisphaera granulorum]|uniref:Methyltransferase family protein n=1 Tax=Quadrisphaera granulorum TaxID=317664 RepID=A0A315ZNT6_9ACTN|nr:class I SAM-dependent methyltransferase [Quadrisphaera granulorum]PWJ46982.1 methyltransferase family protein [Quadrisphaera granulorum]SZE98978.1 Methyltransferase domain-containing protein [Quadrisphaera granulorum]